MNMQQLPEEFYKARKDEHLVVLEGFHACKHAVRFGGKIIVAVTPDRGSVLKLAHHHAPENVEQIDALLEDITDDVYARLAPRPPRTGIIAIARRPLYTIEDMADTYAPIVLIDDARDLDNLGACVRVAAGYGAAGVIATGDVDPWKPSCLRGSAGLHFALPVISLSEREIISIDRPFYIFDERGEDMLRLKILAKSIVVFGSERAGVSEAIKKCAQKIIRIPMQKNVSSLNLATSVAAGLYGGIYE